MTPWQHQRPVQHSSYKQQSWSKWTSSYKMCNPRFQAINRAITHIVNSVDVASGFNQHANDFWFSLRRHVDRARIVLSQQRDTCSTTQTTDGRTTTQTDDKLQTTWYLHRRVRITDVAAHLRFRHLRPHDAGKMNHKITFLASEHHCPSTSSEWMSEWVEFNAQRNTIYVISEAGITTVTGNVNVVMLWDRKRDKISEL